MVPAIRCRPGKETKETNCSIVLFVRVILFLFFFSFVLALSFFVCLSVCMCVCFDSLALSPLSSLSRGPQSIYATCCFVFYIDHSTVIQTLPHSP